MKRNHAELVGLLVLVGILLAALVILVGCAVKRWERRLQRAEDTVDTVEYIADKSEKIIGKTKPALSPPVAR